MYLRTSIAAAAAALSLSAPGADPHGDAARTRVLMIGNSLTAANDLPGMIEALARGATPAIDLTCTAFARADFGLREHWDDGEALRWIRRGGWTHVVLQQGPTSLARSRQDLLDFAERFNREIRAVRAETVIYGVWPPIERRRFFPDVTASYAAAAERTNAPLAAAGDGWQLAWKEEASFQFYGRDGFHPSPLGSYVAAVMLFEAITGISAETLPPPEHSSSRLLRSIPLDSGQAAVIHRAAHDAVTRKRAP